MQNENVQNFCGFCYNPNTKSLWSTGSNLGSLMRKRFIYLLIKYKGLLACFVSYKTSYGVTHNLCRPDQRWEFIKENKKTRTRPSKWSRKKKVFSFFFVAFLVEFLFSWSLSWSSSCFLFFLITFLVKFLFSFINSHPRWTEKDNNCPIEILISWAEEIGITKGWGGDGKPRGKRTFLWRNVLNKRPVFFLFLS